MKVLYIASGTGMTGGATKSLIVMINEMRKRGVEVEVVCPDCDGLTQWLYEEGIKVHVARFKAVYLPPLRTISDLLKWIPRFAYNSWINYRGKSKVKHIAKQSAPDIIHENSSVINVGYHTTKAIGIPDIIHIREFGSLQHKMNVPGRNRRLQALNVYSIPITKAVKSYVGQDSNPKSTQIYDGIVQTSDFRFNENKEKWFLYAGRIESAKGISDLLAAYVDYVKASEHTYPLYVCGGCGDPAYLEKMKQFVAANNLEPYIKWMGEKTDIADFMFRTVATVMPSRCEGLGRVMPEAMTNGSLCVVRNNSGTKEQLENGIRFTGSPIAMAYEHKEELTKALLEITETVENGNAFSPNSDYRKMIERSQSAVKEYFTEESFGDKVYDFYKKILSVNEKD